MTDDRAINFASPINWQHPLNRGLVAKWLTLPGSLGGGTWRDLVGKNPGALTSMGNANNGFRATSRPGGFGHLLFDGSAGYCSIPNSGSLQPTGNYTLACWYRTTQTTQGEIVSSYFQNTTIAGIVLGFSVTGQAAGKLGLLQGNNVGIVQGTTFQFVNAATTSNNGLWHHGAGTWDGTNMTVYVDGVKSNSIAFSVAPAYNVSNAVSIGSILQPGRGAYYNGSCDEVSIYSRALSASEILQKYNLSRQGYPGLLNRVPMTMWGTTAAASSRLLNLRRRAVA